MRFFVNSFPWSLSIDLRAFAIEPEDLLTYKVKISKLEAELFKGGGAWALFKLKTNAYLESNPEKFSDEWGNKFEYFGCLAEEDENTYTFSAYYVKNQPKEIKLPAPEKLKELGLV